MADILNRMEPAQTDEILAAIEESRPDVAKALRRLLFRFEDLAKLTPKARATIFDQIPAEQVVLALREMQGELLEMVLSSHRFALAAHGRARAAKRRARSIRARSAMRGVEIADRAMELISKGEIAS